MLSLESWWPIQVSASGGSKGGPNSFNFMQFLGKYGKIVCWRPPPPGSWRPLLGEILDLPLSAQSGRDQIQLAQNKKIINSLTN